ncbi:tRNA (adenosine(37)-N6)-threonylcarbamoyltransferase complex dimerization subunit type 1 TsaB [Paenibacillus sp. GYB004]|uniref:tRNA (adenosine(37)-N6)-threonylcarbamoyltransferase complex dimerization subunit type 1 TsaB n=1 Tax=Paenibacillus sp. GYB004 TaxID=2994393 RepID=UPI002F965807
MMTEQRDNLTGTLLAIDTSTSALTVALAVDGGIQAERSSHAERNHSIKLLPEIQEMLKEAGTAPADLAAVAVGTGPGSYTGVRIGVTVAKTFSWSLGIPVVGVSSLEALALGDARDIGGERRSAVCWLIPLLDARRGQAYCSVYASDSGGGWETLVDDGIRLVAEWLPDLSAMLERRLAEGTGPDLIVFGGETSGFRETLNAWCGSAPERVHTEIRESGIRAARIAELGWRRIARGERDGTHELVPNYTQLAEAEVKLAQKEQRGGEPFGQR